MKIYYQIDQNDCGISVTQSLIHNYLGIDVAKKEIYEICDIGNRGISIFELEKINKSYGIILESYECEFSELLTLKIKKNYIFLLNVNGLNHYVIANRRKKYFLVYDSCYGKKKISYDEFKCLYSGILIDISHNKNKLEKKSKNTKNIKYFFSEKKIIKNFLVQCLGLLFLFISCYANKLFFRDVILINRLNNLNVVFFLSISLYFLWTVNKFISNLIVIKYKKHYLKKLNINFFKTLNNKKNYFLSKFSEKNFISIGKHIENISDFLSEHLPNILISSFALVIFSIYFLFINKFFLLIVFCSFVFQLFYFFSIKKIKKKYFNKFLSLYTSQKKIFFKLNNFLKNEMNFDKLIDINSQLNECMEKEILSTEYLKKKTSVFKNVNFLFFNIFNLIIYYFGAIWHISNQLSLEYLIISSQLYFYAMQFFQKALDAMFFYHIFSNSKRVYENWLEIENIEKTNENYSWKVPEIIEIKNLNYEKDGKKIFKNLNLKIKKNTFLFGKSGIGKSTILKLISQLNWENTNAIFLDNIAINNIYNLETKKSIIYQTSQSAWVGFDFKKIMNLLSLLEIKKINYLFKKMNLNIWQISDFKNLSNGQKQFLNIFNLIQYSNKLILLDEPTSHINEENKLIIYKFLFQIIKNKNFVVVCEHDIKIKDFFNCFIDLNSIIK